MGWWDSFRNYFYRKSLWKKTSQLNVARVVTNLKDAKTIGIVYNSSNTENDTTLARYAEELRNAGKVVEVVGFVNDNKVEQKEGVLILNKKHLNWMKIPTDERVDDFTRKNFDLLLAAFTEENLPLEYIAAVSQAKWRVGTYASAKTDFYDMMISLGGRNELSYFLEQTTHFLNQVKYDSK